MTVSGFTITRASRQRGHTRDNATQKQAVGHAEGGPGRFPLRDSQLLAQSKGCCQLNEGRSQLNV